MRTPRIVSTRLALSRPYICTSCRILQPRKFSTTSPLSANPPPPPPAAFTCLSSRRLISLSGPDTSHYLQGVITSNISTSSPRTTGFYTSFLNAQGRILHDVFIYPDLTTEAGLKGEGWLIEVDAKEVEKLAKHIKRYKLRAKFDVRVVDPQERAVWSLWKDEGWTAHGLSARRDVTAKGDVGCEDMRAPGMGRRLILNAGKSPEESIGGVAEEVYRVRRYLKGVPEGQDELIPEAALPQESNVDFMGGIDYRKGCYVGQELTIRTHHTGVVRKRILPVMLYGKDEKEPGVLEYKQEINLGVEGIPRETGIGRWEKKGRSAGKFLTGVGNVGLGLCRLEIMTDVLVQGEAGGYKAGDEFKVEWEGEKGSDLVKIKAFVPSWHLTK
ncbi:transferase [Hyphodiscus hymeniophilus]|uniref:Iron-sulfur cluster assembly factor IBA57 homolog, mitochondrial n=1 Tax=Hyphodiscus hymeniophilus TaxID=353542 RepID=A0A9P6VJ62_9HELO|nr:transferase [Hyphodiscus hymeniophilus]